MELAKPDRPSRVDIHQAPSEPDPSATRRLRRSALPRLRSKAPSLALRVTVLLLACAALGLLLGLWVPMVLAIWFANLARPLQVRLGARLGGNTRAAGALCAAMLVVTCAAPLLIGMAVAESAQQLLQNMGNLADWDKPLGGLTPSSLLKPDWLDGADAVDVAGTALSLATDLGMQFLVFVVGFYTVLVHYERGHAWLIAYAPIRPQLMERLAAAFSETGHGLIVSFGLTALAQGLVATVGFVLAGVPNPLSLGALTALASFVPVLGTGLVTVPLTVWFMFSGQQLAAVIMATTVVVTGCVDNPLRAVLSRYADFQLPSFLVFVSILGGLMLLGPSGVLAGPLVVRLAMEAMLIWKEEVARTEAMTAADDAREDADTTRAGLDVANGIEACALQGLQVIPSTQQ